MIFLVEQKCLKAGNIYELSMWCEVTQQSNAADSRQQTDDVDPDSIWAIGDMSTSVLSH